MATITSPWRMPKRPTRSTSCIGLMVAGCYICLLTNSSFINDSSYYVVSDDFFATTHLENQWSPKIQKVKLSSSSSTTNVGTSTTNNKVRVSGNKMSFLENVSVESPLFSFTLPNSGSLALHRYFQCAGNSRSNGTADEQAGVGRYFTNQREGIHAQDLETIGHCIQQNANQSKLLLQGCGKFQVWLDIDVARSKHFCYFPSVVDETLEKLAVEYPNATILQVLRYPHQWYETLSYDLRQRLQIMCQEHHPKTNSFPGAYSNMEEWIHFYNTHVHRIREYARNHPSLRYIEISLDSPAEEAALLLQENLGVDPQCWHDSVAAAQNDTAKNILTTSSAALRRSNDNELTGFLESNINQKNEVSDVK